MTLRVFLRDVNIFSPNMLARGPPCSLTRRTESIHQSSRSNLPRLDHLKTRVLPPGESRIKSDPRLWKGRIVRTHAEFIVLDSTRKPPHRYNRGTQHLERFMIIGCVACRHHVSPPYDGFFVLRKRRECCRNKPATNADRWLLHDFSAENKIPKRFNMPRLTFRY